MQAYNGLKMGKKCILRIKSLLLLLRYVSLKHLCTKNLSLKNTYIYPYYLCTFFGFLAYNDALGLQNLKPRVLGGISIDTQ